MRSILAFVIAIACVAPLTTSACGTKEYGFASDAWDRANDATRRGDFRSAFAIQSALLAKLPASGLGPVLRPCAIEVTRDDIRSTQLRARYIADHGRSLATLLVAREIRAPHVGAELHNCP